MKELVQQLRDALEQALDVTPARGTRRHDAAIDLLAAADAELVKPAPEPNGVVWSTEDYAARLKWKTLF